MDAASAPAQHHAGYVRHHHLVCLQIPFPDAAAGGLDGEAKALFGVRLGPAGLFGAAALDGQQQGKAQANDQGREKRVDPVAGHGGSGGHAGGLGRGDNGDQPAVHSTGLGHLHGGAARNLAGADAVQRFTAGIDAQGVAQAFATADRLGRAAQGQDLAISGRDDRQVVDRLFGQESVQVQRRDD